MSKNKIDKKTVMELIDLTSLNSNDDNKVVTNLCAQANNSMGSVAAVCIYPQFVSLANGLLKDKKVQVATVVNFPLGNEPVDKILQDIKKALADGADEIDLVIPYQEYLAHGYSDTVIILVKESKKLCQDKILKVILETGELKSQQLIFKAASDAIISGADFIKTSTGKTPVGATLAAVKVMLFVIKETHADHPVGLKVSGGVKTLSQALEYIELVKRFCGDGFICSETLRFGASGLLNNLLEKYSYNSKINRVNY